MGSSWRRGGQILDAPKGDGDRRPARASTVTLRPCDGMGPDDDVATGNRLTETLQVGRAN